MNLREWITNSEEVNKSLASIDRAETDSITVANYIQNVTKRIILKEIASVFDPLGLFCPVVLRGKVLLQELWKKGINWDERVSDQDRMKWSSIISDIAKISEYCVPRCFGKVDSNILNQQLLCFCDASEKAYTAVIYLYQLSERGAKVILLFAKSRLAPVKKITIPRLELLAVVIGVRCIQSSYPYLIHTYGRIHSALFIGLNQIKSCQCL